jgi:hypothetical protein
VQFARLFQLVARVAGHPILFHRVFHRICESFVNGRRGVT